jgi:hypothetical protein
MFPQQALSTPCLLKSPVDLKFIYQIVNCLYVGNSFIMQFTSTLSTGSVFEVGATEIHVALKYTAS